MRRELVDKLVEHQNNFLINFTGQQIFTCFVVFFLAILNILRMRNLFSCNLIILLLISSKLLSLLAVFLFVLIKFIKLLGLAKSPFEEASFLPGDCFSLMPKKEIHNQQTQGDTKGDSTNERSVYLSLVEASSGGQHGGGSIPRSRFKCDKKASRLPNIISEAEEEEEEQEEEEEEEEEEKIELNSDTVSDSSARLREKNSRATKVKGTRSREKRASNLSCDTTISRLINVRKSNGRPPKGARNGPGSGTILEPKRVGQLCQSAAKERAGSSLGLDLKLDLNPREEEGPGGLGGSGVGMKPKEKRRKGDLLALLCCRCNAGDCFLITMSLLLSLFCLYLRLMSNVNSLSGGGSGNFETAKRAAGDWLSSASVAGNQASSSGLGSVSLVAIHHHRLANNAATTTEASTRYESSPSIGEQQQQPSANKSSLNQAEAAARFQQAASNPSLATNDLLRQLNEQLESLQIFLHFLTDLSLQTNRFSCTLSSANYAPVARASMLALYASLTLLVLCLNVAIGQLARKQVARLLQCGGASAARLRQLDSYLGRHLSRALAPSSSLLVGGGGSLASSASSASSGCSSFGRRVGRNSSNYTNLLNKNLRHHQSNLEMRLNLASRSPSLLALHHRKQQQQPAQLQPPERAPCCTRKRLSSSMSSLLPEAQTAGTGATSGASRLAHEERPHWYWLPLTLRSMSSELGAERAPRRASGRPRRRAPKTSCPKCRGRVATAATSAWPRDQPPEKTMTKTSFLIDCEAPDAQAALEAGPLDSGGAGRGARRQLELASHQERPHQSASSTSGARGAPQTGAPNPRAVAQRREHQAERVAAASCDLAGELERDVRLGQAVVVFAQLLNHGPILVSDSLSRT